MKTKAILEVYGTGENKFVNLYLPEDVWKKLVEELPTNRLEVVLKCLTSIQEG